MFKILKVTNMFSIFFVAKCQMLGIFWDKVRELFLRKWAKRTTTERLILYREID